MEVKTEKKEKEKKKIKVQEYPKSSLKARKPENQSPPASKRIDRMLLGAFLQLDRYN